MSFQFKQTPQEIDANFAAIEKQLLPAKLAVDNPNFTMISNYLLQRHMGPDGLVDASIQNVGRAISACVNALTWAVAPPPKPKEKPPQLSQGADAASYRDSAKRIDSTRELERIQQRELMAAAKTAEEVEVAENLELCRVLCESSCRSSRNTHSKTARLREALKEKFQAGRKLKMTREQSELLYKDLLDFCDRFPE